MELIKEGFDFAGEFEKLPKVYNTDELKINTTEEMKFIIIDEIKKHLKENREKLGIKDIIDVDGVRVLFEKGWGLIRASNTTPVLVTRFEAKTKEALEEIKNKLQEIIKKFV
jgi:phosphomannomutase/phosphoglucomutase